jgi:hypothetical protein
MKIGFVPPAAEIADPEEMHATYMLVRLNHCSAVLIGQGKTRIPELLPIRYARMKLFTARREQEPKVRGLSAGGEWIRTSSTRKR